MAEPGSIKQQASINYGGRARTKSINGIIRQAERLARNTTDGTRYQRIMDIVNRYTGNAFDYLQRIGGGNANTQVPRPEYMYYHLGVNRK